MTCFSLMGYAKNKAKALRPTGHIQTGGTMSEMRYADTKILIVTCYLLPQGLETLLCLRSGFAMPSLQVRFHRWSINGLTTDLQRR